MVESLLISSMKRRHLILLIPSVRSHVVSSFRTQATVTSMHARLAGFVRSKSSYKFLFDLRVNNGQGLLMRSKTTNDSNETIDTIVTSRF